MAWTTPKTWSVGETLTAANFNTHIRDNLLAVGPHLIARKTSDQTNNSVTMAALTELTLSVAANEVWLVRFMLLYTSPDTADLAVRTTFPTGGTTAFICALPADSANAFFVARFTDTTSPGGSKNFTGTTGALGTLIIEGHYINGANAGTLGLDFAQVAASGTPTTVKANSTLWAVKLA